MNDRDSISVRGIAVRHTTAQRDWLCGECGSRLATRFLGAAPHWRPICTNDAGHDPDKFVHKQTWAYIEHRRHMDAARAQDVFDHLPAELQAAIAERS